MEFVSILSTIGMALFGVLGLYLFFKNSSGSISNKLLGLFFLLWMFNFLDGSLMLSGFFLDHPNLAFLEEPNLFLYGPILFFYTRSITNRNFKWKAKYIFHFIPFFILTLIILFTFHLKVETFKEEIISSINSLQHPKELFIPVTIVFIHIFTYIFFAKKIINDYHKKLKENYSSINTIWLNENLNFLIAIMLASFGVSFLQVYGNLKLFYIGLVSLILLMIVFIVRIIFKALETPQLFNETSFSIGNKENRLDEIEKEIIYNKVLDALEKDKVFLRPDLTLEDLSNQIEYNSRKVSLCINDTFHQSFFDLINTYRIEYACKKIKETSDKGLTILEVMYESGFNSKSSFNTQFKKKIGLTPSEFKQTHFKPSI